MHHRVQSWYWHVLVVAVAIAAGNVHGQIAGIVSQVSQASYESYHLTIESMGLGLYGGPSYNMGMRNRDGWAGPGSLGNQETRLYLQDTMTSMGMGVSVQGNYRNVIAELPGHTTPDRIFIVSAHYDHISGNRPGGDDNASGTAGMLEAARILSQYRFDSTIRFIGFNAEEDGLLGSKDYVSNYIVPNQQNVVGVVNMDMILRPGFDVGTSIIDLDLSTRTTHAPSVAWAHQYRNAAATYVPSLVVDSTIAHVTGASDHDPFVAGGFPAFLASENTAQEIWGGSNIYYHGAQDASDRLANNPNNPSGVVYDYPFATDVVRGTVALIAQQAGFLFEMRPCDFNIDGLCDLDDLNQMLLIGPVGPGVVVVPGANDQFDLTGNGMIDNADVDAWLADAANYNGFSSSYRRGDANLDGIVDGTDFGMWNSNKFTANLHWDQGDFNGDGATDGGDFGLWNSTKFTASDQIAVVPEPAGWILIGWCVGLLCRRSPLLVHDRVATFRQ